MARAWVLKAVHSGGSTSVSEQGDISWQPLLHSLRTFSPALNNIFKVVAERNDGNIFLCLKWVWKAKMGTAGRVLLNLFPSTKHQSFNQVKSKELSKKSFKSFQRRRDRQIGTDVEPMYAFDASTGVHFGQWRAVGNNLPGCSIGFSSRRRGFSDPRDCVVGNSKHCVNVRGQINKHLISGLG